MYSSMKKYRACKKASKLRCPGSHAIRSQGKSFALSYQFITQYKPQPLSFTHISLNHFPPFRELTCNDVLTDKGNI